MTRPVTIEDVANILSMLQHTLDVIKDDVASGQRTPSDYTDAITLISQQAGTLVGSIPEPARSELLYHMNVALEESIVANAHPLEFVQTIGPKQ